MLRPVIYNGSSLSWYGTWACPPGLLPASSSLLVSLPASSSAAHQPQDAKRIETYAVIYSIAFDLILASRSPESSVELLPRIAVHRSVCQPVILGKAANLPRLEPCLSVPPWYTHPLAFQRREGNPGAEMLSSHPSRYGAGGPAFPPLPHPQRRVVAVRSRRGGCRGESFAGF